LWWQVIGGSTVPESKGRKKDDHNSHKERKAVKIGSPGWIAPAMVTFFIIGLAYIVTFYLTSGQLPFMNLFNPLINVGIGFAFIIVGFILATKWK
jgi:hypothetical protein